ncbi:hypothetical protein CFOL_v3_20145 [Cephalotus follicularis]|uniref:Uncharacterized protein n=1 Tax=Cephalotus follicularis TaxID=3775 RepID=A0A1Q3C967_CEPFO|nr:hypothetical protein CFOL_v3_20145 [Cephalotus follicularis]
MMSFTEGTDEWIHVEKKKKVEPLIDPIALGYCLWRSICRLKESTGKTGAWIDEMMSFTEGTDEQSLDEKRKKVEPVIHHIAMGYYFWRNIYRLKESNGKNAYGT